MTTLLLHIYIYTNHNQLVIISRQVHKRVLSSGSICPTGGEEFPDVPHCDD